MFINTQLDVWEHPTGYKKRPVLRAHLYKTVWRYIKKNRNHIKMKGHDYFTISQFAIRDDAMALCFYCELAREEKHEAMTSKTLSLAVLY